MILSVFSFYLSLTLVLLPDFLTLRLLISKRKCSQLNSVDGNIRFPERSLDVIVPVKVPEDEVFAYHWLDHFREFFPNSGTKLIIASNGTWKERLISSSSAISVSHSNAEESKASNVDRALSVSTGEFVAVFDADARPTELVDLDCVARNLAKADCVQGANIVSVCGASFVGELCAYGSLLSACTSKVFASGDRKTSQFRGTNGYFRREVVEAMGFKVDTALEDIDVTIRLLLEGRTIAYVPQLVALEAPPMGIFQVLRQRVRWNLGWGHLARRYFFAALRNQKLPIYQRLRVAGYLAWIALILPGSVLALLLGPHALVGIALIFCAKYFISEMLLRKSENSEEMRRLFEAASDIVNASVPQRFLWSVCFTCLDFLKCLALIGALFGTSSKWPVTRKIY